MKIKKIAMSMAASLMVLSLAACGNKSTTETKKDSVESSHVVKKHDSKKKNTLKNTNKVSSSSVSTTNNNSESKSTNANTVSNNTTNKISNTKNASQQTQTMTETDAKNLVKEHLSNQRAKLLEAGQGEPNQPAVSAIDGFSATQNGTNDWTVTGTYNGKVFTYHVNPNAVTGA